MFRGRVVFGVRESGERGGGGGLGVGGECREAGEQGRVERIGYSARKRPGVCGRVPVVLLAPGRLEDLVCGVEGLIRQAKDGVREVRTGGDGWGRAD